jgi:hypothetical protein
MQILENLLTEGAAAFFGAFFAVFLGWCAGVGRRFYDRRRANHRAIVELEYTSNRHLNYLSGAAFEIRSIKDAVEKARSEGVIPAPGNRLEPIPFSESLLTGLSHIDLVNDLFQYLEELRKFNGSVTTLNRQYDLYSNALLNRTIGPEVYARNFSIYLRNLDEISPFIADLEAKAKKLCAASRVLAKSSAPLLDRIVTKILKKKYGPQFRAEVAAELKILDAEMAEIRKHSKDHIDRISGQAP